MSLLYVDSLPICPQTMTPAFNISSGLEPKYSGVKQTKSATLPTSIEPTAWPIPCARALVSIN